MALNIHSMRAKSFLNILFLCLRSRCPICGVGELFTPILKVRSFGLLCMPPDRCNYCSFKFCREPGYYFGVLTPLLPIFALSTGLVFVVIYYLLSHPDEAFQLLVPGAMGTAVGLLLFFRPAVAIFMSLDHAIDPPDFVSSSSSTKNEPHQE